MTQVPVANIGASISFQDERHAATQVDLDAEHEMESIIAGSTPASVISCDESGAIYHEFTPNSMRSSPQEVLISGRSSTVPIREPLDRGCSNSRVCFQQDHTRMATIDHSDDLPFKQLPQTSRKRGSIVQRGANSSDWTQLLQSCPSNNTSFLSPSETHNSDQDFRRHDVYHQMEGGLPSRYKHNAPSTSTHSVNPIGHSIACKPMTFSGSSSGLAGLPSDFSWQITNDPWTARHHEVNHPSLAGDVDTGAHLAPYTSDIDDSGGGDFSESYFGNEYQTNPWRQPVQEYSSANTKSLEADLQKQYLMYLPSNLKNFCLEPGDQRSLGVFPPVPSMGTNGQVMLQAQGQHRV